MKFNQLNQSEPNTGEMNIIFEEIKNSLDNQTNTSKCIFINIDAMAGSGKSNLIPAGQILKFSIFLIRNIYNYNFSIS